MSDMMEVTILGRKMALKRHGDESYMREVVSYVNDKFAEVARLSPGLTDANVAILASLNIADDLFDAKGRQRAAFSQIERRCDDLLQYIESKL